MLYVCMFVCLFVWKISSKYKTFSDDGTMLISSFHDIK